ncbi:hypothetical protein QEH59_17640 [Coraliomargarita sp. SDUM461004]|uniref:Beta-galactosidase trimerisation domain-containing protein n=1 Tax=Thalassobacterium sedimentorum TaxID=3041258 RepID=A0ABU1AN84_9BACT|nr:hypothetical protein [Coraliomargarita sp. SDUM461004]MDQ8196262.1 hypothetical protein [Coraliomargarita sp. SDUM461004]
MIGETGANNGLSPCPLCENWQAYLIEIFCHLTREIEPVAMWIEDDWRLHNHGEEMGFGGCFCDVCLERFAQKTGEAADRKTVLARILAGGTPHPWRAHWLEHAKESLLEPAEKLAAALKQEAPAMRIGLMSSIPDVHSVEGRDWNRLMDLWSQGDKYLIRPHMPPYTEEPPIQTPPTYSRHTLANLDGDCDIYPELENSPRCGPYSVSHAYSVWEIQNAILYGAQGITINHFDNMGMNTYYDRDFGKALGAKREVFDALMNLELDDRKARGVKILFSPDVARHTQTANTASLDAAQMNANEGSLKDLQANSVAWSKVFYALGIAHGFTRSLEGDDILAVSDQTLRCYSDSEIETLLSRKLLLDLPSAEILVQRGFGALIGVQDIARMPLEQSAYSIEEVNATFFGELEGGVKARMCAQRCTHAIGVLHYAPGVETLSTIKNAQLDTLFPGSGLFTNTLGGTIYTTCYPLDTAQFYMAYFNRVRQEYWTKLLFKMGGAEQTIACEHPLQVHAHNLQDGISIAATNVIYDTVKRLVIKLPSSDIAGKTFQVLKKANWETIHPEISHSEDVATLQFDLEIPTLQTAFITIRK